MRTMKKVFVLRVASTMTDKFQISTCYNMVAATNTATTDPLRVQLYMNVTSCILAMARCNPVNPITGLTQNNRFTTTSSSCLGGQTTQVVGLYNALQINANGDLQILAFPATTAATTQLCSSTTLTAQSRFPNVICP